MRKKWRGWLGGFSCFGKQKRGTRIVPASLRVSESNLVVANQPNGGAQVGGIANPSGAALLAPPSSPASFSNSALPSTVQSPNNNNNNCFLSVNSPVGGGGRSSTMYATGPYAHETQLVSPPVFSAFTTEPSTAPLTPPPELAHFTNPSSPDVPYAQFLSSRSGSGRLYGFDKKAHDSNFFCPATFAQFYLDPSSNPQSAGRLSVSKESDAYSYNQNRNNNKPNKQDVEELEAYRASFGFSADEIVTTTTQYVEISDMADDSFTIMTPSFDHVVEGHRSSKQYGNRVLKREDAIFSKIGGSRNGRKQQFGLSSSDAEVEYRRSRSLRLGMT